MYFETKQNVIQSIPMSDFSVGFSQGSLLLLKRPKTLEVSGRRLDK